METARWIVAAVTGAISLFCIVGNPVTAWLARRQGRNYSWVPFVGAMCGVLSCVACPAIGLSWWMLLPVVLDLTVPMFVYVVVTGRLWSRVTPIARQSGRAAVRGIRLPQGRLCRPSSSSLTPEPRPLPPAPGWHDPDRREGRGLL